MTDSDCITQSPSEDHDGDNLKLIGLPQKKYFRQRAHVNPIADHGFEYPFTPKQVDWQNLYKLESSSTSTVRYLDVGCGFGGLLIALSNVLADNELALGMEIRGKVSEYVQKRILALRSQNPGKYKNVWCIRTNAMRYIPNYINKGQLTKMFFLFPDPHFKKGKHKWRIINDALLAEYAYVCAVGAIVYIATDVEELFKWMSEHLARHPLFEELTSEEISQDSVAKLITTTTEESKKVERNSGQKFYTAFRRVEDKLM